MKNQHNVEVPVLEDGHYYIAHYIFKTDKPKLLHLINECDIKDGRMSFETVKGKQNMTVEEFFAERGKTDFALIKPEELDVKDSLHYWFKQGNYVHQGKEFVMDESLKTGTIYKGQSCHFGIMLMPEETQVRWKLIREA